MNLFRNFANIFFSIDMWIRSTFFAIALAALYVSPVAAGVTFTVTNKSDATRTLSDLIGYTGENNTGMSEIKLQKGNATDNISLAKDGTKNINFTKDVKSFTISWLDKDGKEVETDINKNTFTLTADLFAFFERPDGGDFAVNYSDGNGFLPTINSSFGVVNGKIPGFDQITFYDVGPNGFIQRDSLGNPLSPLLNGVSVTTAFQYSLLAVPELDATAGTSALTLLAGALSLLAERRRRPRSDMTA